MKRMKCLICIERSADSSISEKQIQSCKAFCHLFSFSESDFLNELTLSSFCTFCSDHLDQAAILLFSLNEVKEKLLNLWKFKETQLEDCQDEIEGHDLNISLRQRLSKELQSMETTETNTENIIKTDIFINDNDDEVLIFLDDQNGQAFDNDFDVPTLTLVAGDEETEVEVISQTPTTPSDLNTSFNNEKINTLQERSEKVKTALEILTEKYSKPSFVLLKRLEDMTNTEINEQVKERKIQSIFKKVRRELTRKTKQQNKKFPKKSKAKSRDSSFDANDEFEISSSDENPEYSKSFKTWRARKKETKPSKPKISRLKDIKCPVENCKFMYTQKASELQDHARSTHPGEKIFKCHLCEKGFSCLQSYYFHLRCHERGFLRFMCDQCPNSYYSKVILKKHINVVHAKKSEEDYEVCEECGKRLTRWQMKFHRFHHRNMKINVCETCNKGFECGADLKKHQIKHSFDFSTGKKPFPCDLCDTGYASSAALKAHVKRVHSEKKRLFECNECDYKSQFKGAVKNHTFRLHTPKSEWPYKCTWKGCDGTFVEKLALEAHLRKHEGKRIFQCEHCEKSFYRKAILTDHLKLHANDSFVCENCGKNYKTKKAVRTHRCTFKPDELGNIPQRKIYTRRKKRESRNNSMNQTKVQIIDLLDNVEIVEKTEDYSNWIDCQIK